MENKKNLKTTLIIAAFFAFAAVPVFAGEYVNVNGDPITYEGLVPCGWEGCPCSLCHFFVMIAQIIDFALIIIGSVGALMMAVGGIMFIFSTGDPANKKKGMDILKNTGIGLLIAFGSYLIISIFLSTIGVASWTGLDNWYEIKCEVPDECDPLNL